MYRPVLQDEAKYEHKDPERPEHCDRRDVAVFAIPDPQPFQQQHGKPVDGPEGQDASYGMVGREFPGVAHGIAKDLPCEMERRWSACFAVAAVATVGGRSLDRGDSGLRRPAPRVPIRGPRKTSPLREVQMSLGGKATLGDIPAITSGPWKFSSGWR